MNMMFDEQDQQAAPNPYEGLIKRNQEIQSELDKLKTVKTPSLSEPVQSPDDPEQLSTEVLRGLFQGQIPNSDTPKFGDAFRQSISPAREVLANMFNGMSANLTGTKFKTVRDQAFEKFVTEKKLGQEQEQIQQTLKIHAAQIAQNVLKERNELDLKREVEDIRSAGNDADRVQKLLSLQQRLGGDNTKLLQLLATEKQNKTKNELEAYKERDTGDHLWDASRRKVEASLAAQGVDINTPEGYNKVLQATTGEWQKLIQMKEQITGKKKTGDHNLSGLTQAVLTNPALWENLTPTARTSIAPELAKAGFTGFGIKLGEAAVKQLADSRSAVNSLQELRETLVDNKEFIGPLKGLAALNPFNVKARVAQAEIDKVRQRVGKALEGGVLRKEDEDKYKKILATLRDEPETAIAKVDGLISTLNKDIDIYITEQQRANRVVNSPKSDGTVTMVFPNGVTREVPASDVQEAELKYKGKRK